MSDGKWLEAERKEKWLVANDNEPGRKWFGRTVQTARQDRGLSVAELASRVNLAEGTIRAIERGGRAPSEASGLRILTELFSRDEWSKNDFNQGVYEVKDPKTGSLVDLEFGAKFRGDNGSWSRDRRDDEILHKVEKYVSENPEKWQTFRDTLAGSVGLINTYATHLKEPINDVNLGKAIRRLPEITNLQADHLDKLLWLWGRINADTESVEVIDGVKKIEKILASLPSEDKLEKRSEATD